MCVVPRFAKGDAEAGECGPELSSRAAAGPFGDASEFPPLRPGSSWHGPRGGGGGTAGSGERGRQPNSVGGGGPAGREGLRLRRVLRRLGTRHHPERGGDERPPGRGSGPQVAGASGAGACVAAGGTAASGGAA